MAKTTAPSKARVLAHLAQHGADNGDLLVGPEAVIKGLASAGFVDPHPDAVAYAEEQGARVVEVAAAE